MEPVFSGPNGKKRRPKMARILKLNNGDPFDISCVAQYPTDTKSALKTFVEEQAGNPDDVYADIIALNCWVYKSPTGDVFRSHP